jgi:helix-turn-helix protein
MTKQNPKYDNPARNSKPAAGPSITTSADGPTMKAGLKLYRGHPAGRDPRKMTKDELKAVGHDPMSPLQALRARCLDCCGHQEREVAHCPAVDCPAWPFRMGTDPWRKPASEARREAARRVMTNLNARRRKRAGPETSASPPERGIAPLLAEGSEVAPIWAAVREDRGRETEPYWVEADGSGQAGNQVREDRMDQALGTPGEISDGMAARHLDERETPSGIYWLQTQGRMWDNTDMKRAVLNALKPTRTGRGEMTPNVPEPLITEGEAASILRVSLTSLRRWRRQGSGPVYRKLGRAVRYRPEDLADFVGSALRRETGWRHRQLNAAT